MNIASFFIKVLISSIASAVVFVSTPVSASVFISEVAWMGSSDNANAEWIELYSDETSAVSLSGYVLTSNTGSPSISLSGSIAPNSFYLLERTSDDTVPGIPAGKIYTGALANSGLTLILKNAAGEVVDTVVGGTDWKNIGGDNATKHTAQKVSGVWSTAPATAGAANISGTSAGDTTSTTTLSINQSSTTPVVTIGGSISTGGADSAQRLYVTVGVNRIVATHAATTFRAVVYDQNGKIRHSDVDWTFGDGGSHSGEEVQHTYHASGTYAVVARATSGHVSSIQELTVVVKDVVVEVVGADTSFITIKNSGASLVDLSQWALKSQKRKYRFPNDTVISAGGTIKLPVEYTRLTPVESVELLYPSGKVADTFVLGGQEEAQKVAVYTAPVESVQILEIGEQEAKATTTATQVLDLRSTESSPAGIGALFAFLSSLLPW